MEFITLNEDGYRIGESHPRSTISNDQVDQMRSLHEDSGWSYERISRKMKIPTCTIAKICRYERRTQTPERYVRV